ncbi:SDR family NAD(P)-dependent oxidoreductase [Ruegeria sp. SCP11]|uniref:SDR family NAD(P)-dependent oxidoreductase n=1 Tax=Ruegeria sp. SCP11 TaxID=3141378 RepID=UPI003336E1C1
MPKNIFITGATDGIGRATAVSLADQGHHLLIHGRNLDKLVAVSDELKARGAQVETFRADLSDLSEVRQLAVEVRAAHRRLDVLINNAGVLRTDTPITADGLDVRFVVNTFAPALLSQLLLPLLPENGRIIHLSSAAQAPIDLAAMTGQRQLEAMEAYAQSKLAVTMWSQAFAEQYPDGPTSIAVNPGSLLATNMVQQGFGVAGNDIGIGADILIQAALSPDFAKATGRYFDNDSGQFAAPHRDAAIPSRVEKVVDSIRASIAEYEIEA